MPCFIYAIGTPLQPASRHCLLTAGDPVPRALLLVPQTPQLLPGAVLRRHHVQAVVWSVLRAAVATTYGSSGLGDAGATMVEKLMYSIYGAMGAAPPSRRTYEDWVQLEECLMLKEPERALPLLERLPFSFVPDMAATAVAVWLRAARLVNGTAFQHAYMPLHLLRDRPNFGHFGPHFPLPLALLHIIATNAPYDTMQLEAAPRTVPVDLVSAQRRHSLVDDCVAALRTMLLGDEAATTTDALVTVLRDIAEDVDDPQGIFRCAAWGVGCCAKCSCNAKTWWHHGMVCKQR